MGNLVWTHSTWDIVLTNIFLKPVRVVINLLVAVVTVALGIPFVWCLPTLLQILEDAADGERMGSNSDLSSSLCCCCCCDTDLGPDVEMGQESNRDESCCTFLICTICCLGCCRPSRHRRRRYGP